MSLRERVEQYIRLIGTQFDYGEVEAIVKTTRLRWKAACACLALRYLLRFGRVSIHEVNYGSVRTLLGVGKTSARIILSHLGIDPRGVACCCCCCCGGAA